SDKHGWTDVGAAHLFVGKKREDARKLVIKEFEARGLLEDTRPYRHTVGVSDRSKAAIEPYLSDQWYVRVTDPRMAASANAALAPEQRTHAQAGSGPARAGSGAAALPAEGREAGMRAADLPRGGSGAGVRAASVPRDGSGAGMRAAPRQTAGREAQTGPTGAQELPAAAGAPHDPE